jgi:hypothetical protein
VAWPQIVDLGQVGLGWPAGTLGMYYHTFNAQVRLDAHGAEEGDSISDTRSSLFSHSGGVRLGFP